MNSSKKLLNKANEDTHKSVSAPTSTSTLGKGTNGPGTKAIVMGVFCALLILVLCIGVGVQQFKPQTVLKINNTKFTMDNMMYPIYERESAYLPSNDIYEQIMNTSVWDTSYMGSDPTVDTSMSNSEGLKQEIINAETEYEVLYQEAVKADYKLTDEEKQDAKDQAAKAVKGLSWSQKLQLSISKNKLTKRFEKRILADRYKEDKRKETDGSVDENTAIASVSKDDLRQYDVQFYAFSKTSTDEETQSSVERTEEEITKLEKELKSLAKSAKKAEDFTKLIDDSGEEASDIEYDSASFTEQDGWSQYLSDDNLKKIKAMKKDEISGVIKDETTGYYMVVKMIDNNSTESYDEACDTAIEDAKNTAYYDWLEEAKKNYTIKVYDSVWNDVTIGTVTTGIVTADDLAKIAESDSSEATSEEE
ncbi:MAG: peptidyl-prolyl cis-trans isomerase [Lachnospiraceae bacterium]|nr:peptidyl-prolyl cis-trans isomerase [Lachnospiraceae bacterium]